MAPKNITLIEGPPFALEYRHLIKRRKIPTTSFEDVFSNTYSDMSPERRYKKHDYQPKVQTLVDTAKANPIINLNRPNTPANTQSPKHSSGKSFRPRLVNLYDEDISEQMIKDEIIDITLYLLEESPKHIDFGVIRERVTQTLLLGDDLWSEGFWHDMSLENIKQTVVSSDLESCKYFDAKHPSHRTIGVHPQAIRDQRTRPGSQGQMSLQILHTEARCHPKDAR